MSRKITFLVYPDFMLLDLSGPMEAFGLAGQLAGDPYCLEVVSPGGGPVRSACGLEIATTAAAPVPGDSFLVIGARAPPELDYLRGLAAQTAAAAPLVRRVASVCTGAFVLAEAGLLDGRPATTHWLFAPLLQRLYPAVGVEGDRIYTRSGNVWTSAGMVSGIDMVLAMIEDDFDADIARSVARMMVVYHRRPAGHAQASSLLDVNPDSDRIRRVLSYARDNLARRLTLEELAQVANLSVRQFGRTFSASTGTTPARAVERLRIDTARPMIEAGRMSFEEVARRVGFTDADRMRESFARTIGFTPQELRRIARIPEDGRRERE